MSIEFRFFIFRSRSPCSLSLLLLFLAWFPSRSESSCRRGCDLALGSYYVTAEASNLTYVAGLFNLNPNDVLPYNALSSKDSLVAGTRLKIGFPCDCISGDYLARRFSYTTQIGDTYDIIASDRYANLTTTEWVAAVNSYPSTRIPEGVSVNVTINCSCGDASVSREYGLFETYPLRPGETLDSVAAEFNFSSQKSLLDEYNPGKDFSAGTGIVYIPARDQYGSYRPIPKSKNGLSSGGIAGICVGVVFLLLIGLVFLYFGVCKKSKAKKSLLPSTSDQNVASDKNISASTDGTITPFTGFTMEKSVEFSLEELSKATNDFSMANKIGEGGFGAVYYAELRGEKVAIKKMEMQSSREFFAELKVLTRVHHLNLVRLIGYCTEGSLFLVYEFIENGNLSQHLRGSGRDPLTWSSRVQIALDSARGLEYIHEHTVPVYIHRDIKSANILIDNNLHAKVADFGLSKLAEVGGASMHTRLVGTFGYMPPEYAQLGEVSAKVDVYAFGVVLYELISAKEAIVKSSSVTESIGLVSLFEDSLSQPDAREKLKKLVDPRLGDNYPIDSVLKMAQLAMACTQENPQLRPSMRSIVVALMTMSSSTDDWDLGALHANQSLLNLMSGR
ncbi:Chitin elicitor receptor kinase 1 [Apostasia shenzhenica]|uniref:non-specific serine/threonine protein kinase n=1 Tax=Apostasia shenzhenica TaxID=1088818 RepID=A0A2H9ZW95_9ASPA|nr:Chitin elicitor receptor kinase 1 [Apostasia shenzhenica]